MDILDNKKWSDLTEEQQKEVTVVLEKFKKESMTEGLKTVGLLWASNIFILIADQLIAHSLVFCFFASVLNGVFIANSMMKNIRERRELIKQQIREIVSR